jgi:uncharacterized protein YaaW (UPF0174 family)
MLPVGGFLQKQLVYDEILDKLLKKHNLNTFSTDTIQDKEEKILLYKFKKIIENLSPEEKIKFENEILKKSKEEGISNDQIISINTISALTIANLSGFGLYIMASTVVGGLTSILGITLPFAIYTGMSSVLSVITGPIGWTIGLGYIAYSFRNDNFDSATNKIFNYSKNIKNKIIGNVEHTMLAVSFLASSRIILMTENKKRKFSLETLKQNIINDIKDLKSSNIEIVKKIGELQESLSNNKIKLDDLEEKSFEIDVKIRKIDNFINQTLK